MSQSGRAIEHATTTPPIAHPARSASAARNLAALAIGLLPPYLFVVFTRLSQGRGFTLHEIIFYPLVVGAASLVALLLLHRYFCGEPISALNPGSGSLKRDFALGMALAVAFIVFSLVSQPVLTRLVAPHRNPDGMTLIVGLLQHPLLMLLWFGPVLWIGVAAFEEVARVFCITRIMAIWRGSAGRWAAVLVSTLAFGLMHYYQGPSAIISTGMMGLASAIVYIRLGRFWPLLVAHALYDAFSISFALVIVSRSMG
jgi:membrane protease YdiL (CAAX protease family)